MKTSKKYQLLNNDELMEIAGGLIIYGPISISGFMIYYSNEIIGGLKHAYNSFVAGLTGQSEP